MSSSAAAADARPDRLRWLQIALGFAIAGTAAVAAVRVGGAALYLAERLAGANDIHVSARLPLPGVSVPRTPVGLTGGGQLDSPVETSVVVDYPSPWQFALWVLIRLPSIAVYLTFFVLLYRLVRRARAEGPFTTAAADRLRRLGGVLVVTALVAAALEGVARGLLAATVTSRHTFVLSWDFPGYAGIGGVGLIAVAEVVRRGVLLREDVEGTI
jgi:hypothetical protein